MKKYFIHSLLFLAGSVIGFFLLLYVNSTFRIKKVEVFGSTKDESIVLSTFFKGVSTLTVQQAEINKIVHTRFPTMMVKESRIQFPSTLILVIAKELPFAYLKTDYGYLVLSKSGVIVQKERATDTPQPAITFYQTIHHTEYQTGQQIGFSAIERALIFIALLMDEGYKTETVAIDSVDMIACKTKGFEVAFSQSRPIDLQSHEMRQMSRQIKAGALRIVRLDLRFDKPVVQLPKK
ncbi:MAG: hypothetical protein V1922_01995 [bacterium]